MKRFLAFTLFFLFAYSSLGKVVAQSPAPSRQTSEVGRFSYADMEASYSKRKSFGWDVPVGFVATIKLPHLASEHHLHSVVFHSELQVDKRAALVVLNEEREIIYLESIEAVGGENHIQLAEPLRLPPGTYYVGYYIHSRGRQLKPVVLDGDKQAIKGVNFLTIIKKQPTTLQLGDVLEVQDFASKQMGNLAIAVGISGADVKNIALVEDIIGVTPIQPGAKETLQIRVRNGGVNEISSLEVVLSDGERAKGIPHKCTIRSGEKGMLAIEHQFPQDGMGGELFCSIASVNDHKHSLASHRASFAYRIEQPGGLFALENVLLEYFTTENCGSCPQGSKTIAKLADRLQEEGYEVAQVAHHTAFGRDPYTLSQSEELVKYIFPNHSFAPALVVNRLAIGKDDSFALAVSSQLEEELLEQLKREGQAGRFSNIMLNSHEVLLSGKVANDSKMSPLSLHLLITEDSIATTHQQGAKGTYHHRHVARRFITPLEGVALSPDEAGVFSLTLPLGIFPDLWRSEHLQLVTFVTNGLPSKAMGETLGRVLFSQAVSFPKQTNTTHPQLPAIELMVVDGRLAISGQYHALHLYRPDGRQVSPQQQLPSGVYIARIVTSQATQVVKIIVE